MGSISDGTVLYVFAAVIALALLALPFVLKFRKTQ